MAIAELPRAFAALDPGERPHHRRHHDADPGLFSAAYLRSEPRRLHADFDRAVRLLRAWERWTDLHCEVGVVQGNLWVEVYVHRFEERRARALAAGDLGRAHRLARRLSAELGADTVGWYSGPLDGRLGYWHFRAGVEQRGLVYGLGLPGHEPAEDGCGNWERATGRPQAWEAEVLFSSSSKIHALSGSAEDLGSWARVEAAFACGEIRVGQRLPEPFPTSVAAHLGFPGFVDGTNDVDWSREAEVGSAG
jgi:hypothetical protein